LPDSAVSISAGAEQWTTPCPCRFPI
jgi:hypothetical protein